MDEAAIQACIVASANHWGRVSTFLSFALADANAMPMTLCASSTSPFGATRRAATMLSPSLNQHTLVSTSTTKKNCGGPDAAELCPLQEFFQRVLREETAG
eukprot:4664487-Amphidinium_carterae.1